MNYTPAPPLPAGDLTELFQNARLIDAMTRTTCENECGNCNVCRLSRALAYEKFRRWGDTQHLLACLEAAQRRIAELMERQPKGALATIERVKNTLPRRDEGTP